MPELSASVSASTTRVPRRYYGWALVCFVVGLTLGVAAMVADNTSGPNGQSEFGTIGTSGMLLYLAVYVALVAMDWHGFVRAVAAHRWLAQRPSAATGCIVAILFVFIVFPFVLPLYPFYGVFRYVRGYLDQRRRYPLEHRRRVAELESQLGIEPEVAGQCPHCGKPLQVDAEFCSFCGIRVKPEVQICPTCGTVALPGAKWCARCGNPLDPSAAAS